MSKTRTIELLDNIYSGKGSNLEVLTVYGESLVYYMKEGLLDVDEYLKASHHLHDRWTGEVISQFTAVLNQRRLRALEDAAHCADMLGISGDFDSALNLEIDNLKLEIDE